MTHDELDWYLRLIKEAKLDAATTLRLHMCVTVVEAIENGLNNRDALHQELREHGVKVD